MFRRISRSSSGLHSRLSHWVLCACWDLNVHTAPNDLVCYVGLKMTDWWVETCSLMY